MIEIDTKSTAPPVEREPIARIGEDVLTIPTRFLPTDMLQYLHILQVGGGDAAAKWALNHALGDEGFWRLVDAGAAVTEDDLAAMINCVTGRLLGLKTPVPGPGKAEVEPGPGPAGDSGEEPPDESVWPEESSTTPN